MSHGLWKAADRQTLPFYQLDSVRCEISLGINPEKVGVQLSTILQPMKKQSAQPIRIITTGKESKKVL